MICSSAMAESLHPNPSRKRLRKCNYAVPAKRRSISSLSKGIIDLHHTPFFGARTKAVMITNKYNSKQLLDHYGVHYTANDKDEVLAQKLFEDVFGNSFHCFSGSDQELKAIKDLMYSASGSVDQRPYVSVVLALSSHNQKPGEAIGIPVLLAECHSKDKERGDSYENTIVKATLGLIDQFQFLTHCCREASDLELTGFVFPSSRESKCVTEIKLSWNNWKYKSVEKCLEKEDVVTSLREAKTRILNYAFYSPPVEEMSYLKLSQNDLKKIGDGVTQVPTRSSILATNGSHYFKIYPHNSMVICNLALMEIVQFKSGLPLKQFLLPSTVKRPIVKFPALPYPPLGTMDAKNCLRELVSGVVEALEKIHVEPYEMAHLDVRLDNICFDEQGKPVLIDPDRMRTTDVDAQSLESEYTSVMYRPGNASWMVDHLDWMQLGYMIADVLEDGKSPDYHTMIVGDEILMDNFIRTLIQEGEVVRFTVVTS